jgi:hypothetical protein
MACISQANSWSRHSSNQTFRYALAGYFGCQFLTDLAIVAENAGSAGQLEDERRGPEIDGKF